MIFSIITWIGVMLFMAPINVAFPLLLLALFLDLNLENFAKAYLKEIEKGKKKNKKKNFRKKKKLYINKLNK